MHDLLFRVAQEDKVDILEVILGGVLYRALTVQQGASLVKYHQEHGDPTYTPAEVVGLVNTVYSL